MIVSESALRDYPYTSPVDRQLIADLVDRLDALGAKTIGLDFVFDRPSEPDKDRNLIRSIRSAKANIVLAALDDRTPLPGVSRAFQADFLAQAGRPAGHPYFDENYSPLAMSDRIVRFIAMPLPDDPAQRSFAEALAAADGHDARPRSLYISWLLPPRNGSEVFLTLPAELVLGRSSAAAALPLPNLIRDRIVIVGGDFPDRDQHLTPLSAASSSRYSGIYIHAQILAQLLDGRSVGPLAWPIELLILTLTACGGIWFGRRDRFGHYLFWIRSVGVAGLIAVSAMIFAFLGVIFPITLTLLFLLAGTAFGYHSKRLI